jgi:site-specific DNA-methyltransferase (adenine-specific)
MPAEQYEALKADIARRGVLVPVELDEDGSVLDGHHRARACAELGIADYPTVTRRGLAEDGKREHVLKLNLLRRHLGPVAWAESFRRLAETRGVRLGTGKGDPSGKAASVAALAQELGVKPRTARARLQLASELSGEPDLAAKVDAGEMEAKRARRVWLERQAARRHAAAPPVQPSPAGDIRTEHCDFRTLALEAGSADVIITDPPYLREHVWLWPDLGKCAAQWLRPGGLLITYTGHTTFPEAFDGLREHLSYCWLGSLYMPGPNVWIRNHRMESASKPVLIMANGKWRPRTDRVYFDTFISPKAEKALHDWQQQLAPVSKLVETFSQPGDHVVDPFLGSGTTAVACKQLGRRFTGCDVDPAAVATARERLT